MLIPLHMLRHGETAFLDDYTVERLSQELGPPRDRWWVWTASIWPTPSCPGGKPAGQRKELIPMSKPLIAIVGRPQRGQVHAVQQNHRAASFHCGGHPRRHP